MGYIKHDAIVVTCFSEKQIEAAREKAMFLDLSVSEIIISNINAESSFLIGTDGSKEGWAKSDKGDEARKKWIHWAKTTPDLFLDWAHIRYGGDDPDLATVENHNS